MNIAVARKAEHEKYSRCYTRENYHMGGRRMGDAVADLKSLPCRGSYLDVSCGCGEMLKHAEAMGFDSAQGTEIVPKLVGGNVLYAEVHQLPFSADEFDVVTMFDVIEHLIPGDDELACRELARVAKKHVLITANNKPSFNHADDELHINKRPYEEWDRLFRQWFKPHKVIWIHNHDYVSEGWRVDL